MATKPLLILVWLSVIFLLEGAFPHYKSRAHRIKHAIPNILTALLNGLLTRLLLAGLTIKTIGWAGQLSLGLAPRIPLTAYSKTVIIIISFDIWMYFWHMANHRILFLWLFHRAHHSDTGMDTTTALRFHPGELVLSTFIRLPIVILLGMSFADVLMFETVLNISTLFHHSNLAIPEKWDRILRAAIVTPNMHRVHHSIELYETNSNYTSLLSIWDRPFRSFRKRENTQMIMIGLPRFREEKWQLLPGFLLTPFVSSER